MREVWLVNLRELTFEVYRRRAAGEIVRDTIEWIVPNTGLVVEIQLADIFQGVGVVEP